LKILGILLRQATLIVRHRNRSAVMSRTCGELRSRYNRTSSPLLAREDGGALVEFALVMPMFLTMVTGMFAFGITMNNYIEITDAVSIGARAFVAGAGVASGDQCAYAVSTVQAAAANLNSSQLTVNVSINGASAVTTCAGTTPTQFVPAKVTATYPCSLLIFTGKMACTLTASTTEIVQ
jgi:Flp pilus assembly protein TadG